jgi:FMN-dependent NADH-azoreductase
MKLFINACVRKDSRTRRLAECLLSKLDGQYEEVNTFEIDFPVSDQAFLEHRDSLIAAKDFGNPLFRFARQFAEADEIIIAAPYWDLSFPASLKQYIEQVNVVGITFCYTPQGAPKGLCKAKRLTYVTTSGGPVAPEDFGFGYINAMAHAYYGIPDVRLIKAKGLDIVGADVESILQKTIEELAN